MHTKTQLSGESPCEDNNSMAMWEEGLTGVYVIGHKWSM